MSISPTSPSLTITREIDRSLKEKAAYTRADSLCKIHIKLARRSIAIVLSGGRGHIHIGKDEKKCTDYAALARLGGLLGGFDAFRSRSKGILVDIHVSDGSKVFVVEGGFAEAGKVCEDEFETLQGRAVCRCST